MNSISKKTGLMIIGGIILFAFLIEFIIYGILNFTGKAAEEREKELTETHHKIEMVIENKDTIENTIQNKTEEGTIKEKEEKNTEKEDNEISEEMQKELAEMEEGENIKEETNKKNKIEENTETLKEQTKEEEDKVEKTEKTEKEEKIEETKETKEEIKKVIGSEDEITIIKASDIANGNWTEHTMFTYKDKNGKETAVWEGWFFFEGAGFFHFENGKIKDQPKRKGKIGFDNNGFYKYTLDINGEEYIRNTTMIINWILYTFDENGFIVDKK